MPTLLAALEDPRIADKKFDFYGGHCSGRAIYFCSRSSYMTISMLVELVIDSVSRDLTTLLANGEITAEEAHERFISQVQDELDFL